MIVKSLTKAALGLAAGLALGSIGNVAEANPVKPSFGVVKYHAAPVARRVVVEGRQVREHPGEPYAVWTGFSTFPDFTSAQRKEIEDALQAAGHGGGHGGGGGGGGGTATVAYWEHAITAGTGQSFTMSMVGASPYTSPGTATTISYVPIVLKVTLGNVTYDPQQPACNDTVSVQSRFFNSPLFANTSFNSNGVVITDQLASAFQRANFWGKVATTAYGVRLAAAANPVVVSVSLKGGKNHAMTCAANGKAIYVGEVPISTFDAAIQSVIAKYATPTQLPIVLTSNIVESSYGQCCVLGYHSAVAVTGGVQTYATGTYVDSGVFSNIDDISIWSHEIAEWLDDPFVQAAVAGGGADDLTPSWGHIGQVSGCQNNLEVGDPLTGTEYSLGVVNGYQYHTQDLAYKDWFYRTASEGTGGKYSFLGAFSSPSAVC
jgi:hypothetical protein